MDDFKSRLVEEQAQLEEKLNKLNGFNQNRYEENIDNRRLRTLSVLQKNSH